MLEFLQIQTLCSQLFQFVESYPTIIHTVQPAAGGDITCGISKESSVVPRRVEQARMLLAWDALRIKLTMQRHHVVKFARQAHGMRIPENIVGYYHLKPRFHKHQLHSFNYLRFCGRLMVFLMLRDWWIHHWTNYTNHNLQIFVGLLLFCDCYSCWQ